MNLRSVLLAALFLITFMSVKAQGVIPLTGAPISASWTITIDTAGIVTTTRVEEARSSNGSVYSATYNGDNLSGITIYDVSRGKRITIYPRMKQYTESDAPGGRWVTRTVEEQHTILERHNTTYTREAADQKKDSKPLGVKVIDGMTIYGHHYVRTNGNEQTMEGETWQSDLGFNYSMQHETPSEKKTFNSKLTELKRGEPDASLFVVPDGYTLIQK